MPSCEDVCLWLEAIAVKTTDSNTHDELANIVEILREAGVTDVQIPPEQAGELDLPYFTNEKYYATPAEWIELYEKGQLKADKSKPASIMSDPISFNEALNILRKPGEDKE